MGFAIQLQAASSRSLQILGSPVATQSSIFFCPLSVLFLPKWRPGLVTEPVQRGLLAGGGGLRRGAVQVSLGKRLCRAVEI